MKILVVDDEPIIVKGLKFNLEKEGYEVDTAFDGKEAYDKFRENEYELILLDLMMPVIDGLEVCKLIRKESEVPIIILTAKGDDDSKIKGLEYGADDYITKPFNILELKARLKAILRRTKKTDTTILNISDLSINTLGRKVEVNDKSIILTAKEFDLLLLLAQNKGEVYSREKLLEIIWEYDYLGDVRTVDVHIRRLREKIEYDPSQPKYILTKWGVGYYFEG